MSSFPDVYFVWLRRIEASASIGFHAFELAARQKVYVSVVLILPGPPPAGDEVSGVQDYDFVREGVLKLAAERHFNLQETLCGEILDLCLAQAGVLGAEGLAGREVLGTDVAGAEGPGVEEVQPTRAKAVSATSAAQMREADMAKRYRPAPSVLSAWANPGMPCEGPEQGRPRPLRASVSLRFSPAARRSRPRFRRPTSRRLCRPGRRDPGRRPDAGRGRRDASSPSRRE